MVDPIDCSKLGHDRPCRRNPGCPHRWIDRGWAAGLRFAARVMRMLDEREPRTLRTGRGMTWREMNARLSWYAEEE
jgi:hypothetical protein